MGGFLCPERHGQALPGLLGCHRHPMRSISVLQQHIAHALDDSRGIARFPVGEFGFKRASGITGHDVHVEAG
jgi:hypothetical protein